MRAAAWRNCISGIVPNEVAPRIAAEKSQTVADALEEVLTAGAFVPRFEAQQYE